MNSLENLQLIQMNNIPNKINNLDYIWNNILSSDDIIISSVNNSIDDCYFKKLSIVNYILYTCPSLNLKLDKDIIKFFNILSIQSPTYLLGSREWSFKYIKNNKNLLVQNSVSKADSSNIFYQNFINPIKKILSSSNVKFYFFEFKSKRFNKTKDIIFVFEL